MANSNDKVLNLYERVKFYPENKSASEMLKEFVNKNLKIVGIVDEYGGLSGTLSSNEIYNYFSKSLNKELTSVELIGENEYRLKGDLYIREWRELFLGFIPNYEIRNMDLDTISGLVISSLKKCRMLAMLYFLEIFVLQLKK